MGIKKIKILQSVPVEEGKSYDTKNLQGLFLVKKISVNKNGEQMTAWGTYLNTGVENCPIGVDRLITDKIVIDEQEACDCCSFPLKEKHSGKFINF